MRGAAGQFVGGVQLHPFKVIVLATNSCQTTLSRGSRQRETGVLRDKIVLLAINVCHHSVQSHQTSFTEKLISSSLEHFVHSAWKQKPCNNGLIHISSCSNTNQLWFNRKKTQSLHKCETLQSPRFEVLSENYWWVTAAIKNKGDIILGHNTYFYVVVPSILLSDT